MSKLFVVLLLSLHLIGAEKDEDFLPVKVVKETVDANWDVNALDFSAINERLLQQRSNINSNISASPFSGPDLLSPLLSQCFLYDDHQQYIFRICPFSNVTQHEKSAYAFNFLTTSFHAVLGVYRRWYVVLQEGGDNSTAASASFDSLLYLEGDQCDQGVARQVRLHLLCSTDWTMLDMAYLVNVTEVARCRYQATLASPLFCQLGTVQSRLGPEGQSEWAILEGLLQRGMITRAGYEHYLEELLNRYGLTTKDETSVKSSQENQQGNNSTQVKADLHSVACEERVQQLEREVAKLRAQISDINKTTEV